MDMLDALRLQWEWGADEALVEAPQDRRSAARAAAAASHAASPALARPAALPGPAEAIRLAQSCNSLDDLQVALQNFTGCALRDTATHLVFADGDPNARIILVGEAPGAEEDRAGRPFVGPAGLLLDKMLASIGLDRSKTRIINTVPWRPPGNRNPTESEIALCLPFLLRHIALIRPALLVAAGAVAAKALLTEPQRSLGIRRVRGSWVDIHIPGIDATLPCLPMLHPAYLLRVPAAKRETWHDLISLRERIETLRSS